MPQGPALYEDPTARGNVGFFGACTPQAGFRKKVDEVMHFTDLLRRADYPVHNFSGGMKRRVSLACSPRPQARGDQPAGEAMSALGCILGRYRDNPTIAATMRHSTTSPSHFPCSSTGTHKPRPAWHKWRTGCPNSATASMSSSARYRVRSHLVRMIFATTGVLAAALASNRGELMMTMTTSTRRRWTVLHRRRQRRVTIVGVFRETARALTPTRPALRWRGGAWRWAEGSAENPGARFPKRSATGACCPASVSASLRRIGRRGTSPTSPRWRPGWSRPGVPLERGQPGRLRARPQRRTGLLRRERRPAGQGAAPAIRAPRLEHVVVIDDVDGLDDGFITSLDDLRAVGRAEQRPPAETSTSSSGRWRRATSPPSSTPAARPGRRRAR